MQEQFFIIGGRYQDLNFNAMIEGTSHVLGPFRSYEDAQRTWKERSEQSRSDARARYSIVKSAGDQSRSPQAA